jgi:hypothetical protein
LDPEQTRRQRPVGNPSQFNGRFLVLRWWPDIDG